MQPISFSPLTPLIGGEVLYRFGDKPLTCLVAGKAWIKYAKAVGASTRNAIKAIAYNGDKFPGLVALALDLAAISQRLPADHEDALSFDEYCEVVNDVYMTDIGGIYTLMHRWWGIQKGPNATSTDPPRTRSQCHWERGHDLLIHPKNLLPARLKSGVMEFCSPKSAGNWAEMMFRLPGGELWATQNLPEQWPEGM